MIIGHEKLKQHFSLLLAEGRVHQAYCFAGVDQVGKSAFARFVAATLLGVSSEALLSHPDFYYFSRLADPKTGKLKKDLTVEQARDLREALATRPWGANKYQVVVVDGAEFFNQSSANALLKTLEEPTERAVIFLLSAHEDALLPTIVSRVHLFRFSPVSTHVIAEALTSGYGVEPSEARLRAELAEGRPGRAIEFCNNPGYYQAYLDEFRRWAGLLESPIYIKMKTVGELFEILQPEDDSEVAQPGLSLVEIVDWWILLWRRLLLSGGKTDFLPYYFKVAPVRFWPERVRIIRAIDALGRFKTLLSKNVNSRLALEQAVLHF